MRRANTVWQRTLAQYEAMPVDEGVDEALRDFIVRREASMSDAWH
jgi:trimethylamine--corrinoid protein Co-methyltransferase